VIIQMVETGLMFLGGGFLVYVLLNTLWELRCYLKRKK